jgi:tRNA 2-thiouridine synthesizing protein A
MTDFVIDKACTQTIDARGLACPLPLLKAKQGLNNLASGERLQVLTTDSASVKDFHVFATLSCHHLEAFKQTANVYCYLLIKGSEIVN